MKDFLRLIRWSNLLMVALTMYLMRYAVIWPMLRINNFKLQVKEIDFILIVLSTVLVTAAGYIINDYFDIRIDSLNKPTSNPIGKSIQRRTAMFLHLVFNALAYGLIFIVCYRIGNIKLSLIYLIAMGVLWFYSTNFKKQLVVGNLVVAFLAGMIPLLVGLFEVPLLNLRYQEVINEYHYSFNSIAYFIIAFSFFSFISNLCREIIIDAEDEFGDRSFGAETIPVIFGLSTTNKIIFLLGVLQSAILGYLQYMQWQSNDKISFYFMLVALQIPILIIAFKALRAKNKEHYRLLSKWCKVYMFLGLLYTGIIYFLL
ncbi:MAG: geranylgeranylglycerol-phosphate geranylgeranyltransferase [Bacteroidia bacterium]|nr:geranylgeranylglycerol-phosphate geranylgeranyltransferase [Bacteroidia bacterium]